MVTARSLNKRSTTILIAVVLAAGTGLLLFNYLSTVSRTAQAVPTRSVVIATREIPARTVVTSDMVTVADRPQDSVDPDVSTNAGAVVGQIAFIEIPAGSTLSASKIGRAATGGLTMSVPAGQRAMSIALDPVKGVADLIQAGDRVDVIAVTQARATGDSARAVTILRNKVVLAMGSTMQAPAANAVAAAAGAATGSETAVQTATLAISPAEARTLALADLNATLRLALRSPRDGTRYESGDELVFAAPAVAHFTAPAEAPAATAAPVQAAVAVRKAPGIAIIDGDQFVR